MGYNEVILKQNNTLNIFFWEFLQNFLLVCAFTFGNAAYIGGNPPAAVGITIAFVCAGVVTIRFTEPAIRPGPRESRRETLTNLVFFSIAVILFILYFSWNRGSLPADLLLGSFTGAAAAVFQARAARETVSIQHLFALVVSFAIALAVIRLVALGQPPLQAAVVISLPVTAIIVALDYGKVGSGSPGDSVNRTE